MSAPSHRRKPAAFSLDDPRLQPEASLPPPSADSVKTETAALPHSKGLRWGRLLMRSLAGLLVLYLVMAVEGAVIALVQRQDWLGFLATGLVALAAFAFVMIVLREVFALSRLSAITTLRQKSELALANGRSLDARAVENALQDVFRDRLDLERGRQAVRAHARDVLNAREVLVLSERHLVTPLDVQARGAIGAAARRVAALTSVSPSAIVDVAYVGFENLRLLRKLATLYGGRPGFLATLRLFRLIAGHLALTGGIALTDGVIQQLVGHGVAARISRRFSEGLINGAFTIRIGIAALNVLRPLPYIEAPQPRVRDFAAEFLKFGSARDGASS